jgi:hypothetical protein
VGGGGGQTRREDKGQTVMTVDRTETVRTGWGIGNGTGRYRGRGWEHRIERGQDGSERTVSGASDWGRDGVGRKDGKGRAVGTGG